MRLLLMLLASCAGTLVPLQARAGLAQAGLKVIVVDGDEAANIVAEKLAAVPVIEVRDKDDRRVPGAVVRFLIRKTRDRLVAVFRNGQAEVRTITDAAGQANSSAITPLEPGSFEIDVEVRYPGQTGKATIRQTNFRTAADAKAAGREPGKSSNAQTSTSGGTTGTSAGAAAGATAATTTATSAAVSTGGGMSKVAMVGLAVGGAAGAGAAVVLSRRESDPPAGSIGAVTASTTSGLQASTAFTFSVQPTGFDASSLAYRWEFGDGGTSTEPAPTHVYAAPGAYTVVVTVRDARQSVRSELPVMVHTLSGTWATGPGSNAWTLQLTQSGNSITGLASVGENWTDCPVSGSAQTGTPAIVLVRPACRSWNPAIGPLLVPGEYRLNLSSDGGTLTGTSLSIVSTGPLSENPIVFRR